MFRSAPTWRIRGRIEREAAEGFVRVPVIAVGVHLLCIGGDTFMGAASGRVRTPARRRASRRRRELRLGEFGSLCLLLPNSDKTSRYHPRAGVEASDFSADLRRRACEKRQGSKSKVQDPSSASSVLPASGPICPFGHWELNFEPCLNKPRFGGFDQRETAVMIDRQPVLSQPWPTSRITSSRRGTLHGSVRARQLVGCTKAVQMSVREWTRGRVPPRLS